MRLGSRTVVRSVSVLALIMGTGLSDLSAAPNPTSAILNDSTDTTGSSRSAVAVPAAVPTAVFNTKSDSLSGKRKRDSLSGRPDSLSDVVDAGRNDSATFKDSATYKDSIIVGSGTRKKRAPRPVFAWESPLPGIRDCPTGRETASECWRRDPDLADQELGWPGTRGWSLSLTHWRPLPQESPYQPFWAHSPYLSGGMIPPERFALRKNGADAFALEEAWTPVVPLDTPMTRMDWMRGALSLNVFQLKLHRMLSDRVYLGMDYYSSTASAQPYDYQFNVHQPYLGGWGFLGKLYGPIDRDSASLVLKDTSYSIHALHMRPRVGVWLDTNRVLEFFLDRMSNGTSMTLPIGPARNPGSLVPDGPDSAQAFMPSDLSVTTEGVLYGERHRVWASQWELIHGSYGLDEFRKTGSEAVATTDRLQADLFRARGSLSAAGLPLKPILSLETRSELWEGDPLLAMGGANPEQGWLDAEQADIRVEREQPMLGTSFRLTADAGIGRSSRMDDQVYWLPRYGASLVLDLPFGFGAEAAASSRWEEPAWELLYRSNSARFRFASPALKPRADRALKGEVSWTWKRLSFAAGMDRLEGEDVWLPRVMANPGACAALADSAYASLASRRCADSSGVLTDTLALALRNYASETVDAWHLGLGLGLGHWSLSLDNRFVLNRTVDDPDLRAAIEDWSVPERVFKGRLNWKRGLLNGRLKLDFGWDWEWYSTRYAWVPDLAGNSKVGKLDEYLALDMDAAMIIKTFTLYFKIRNFNHDRYATEPGVHPPGINFRFGVDWVIFN
ncbi:MAG: hypothetical protein ABIW76_00005 [Fibrobacteria bacterium]